VTHFLNQSAYTFTGGPTDDVSRFTIEFVPGIVSGINSIEEQAAWNLYRSNNNLRVSLDQELNNGDERLVIYNQLGQQVFVTVLAQGEKVYDISNCNLPTGNYIAKLGERKALKFRW
jgi:hypothetical protein